MRRVELGALANSGPAAAFWNESLWAAYVDPTGRISVTETSMLSPTMMVVTNTTPHTAQHHVALSSTPSGLVLLFRDAGRLFLVEAPNGDFSGAAQPIDSAGSTIVACTTIGDNLYVLTARDAGGAVMLARRDGAGVWTDLSQDASSALGNVFVRSVALTTDGKDLLLAYCGREAADTRRLTVMRLDAETTADLNSTKLILEAHPTDTIAGLTMCVDQPSGVNKRIRLVATVRDPSTPESHFIGRTLDTYLLAMSDETTEPFFAAMSVAAGANMSWFVAGLPSGSLMAGPLDPEFSLPKELDELRGQECTGDQCPEDPRLYCMPVERGWRWGETFIQNAQRGDLLLTVGTGDDIVGSIFASLAPKQFYDHIGIILDNKGSLVRHCTMEEERLLAPGGPFGVTKHKLPLAPIPEFYRWNAEPLDGFRPDALTYGWPGTITQSVHDAAFTGLNTVRHGTVLNPQFSMGTSDARGFADPEADGPHGAPKEYPIKKLPLHTITRTDHPGGTKHLKPLLRKVPDGRPDLVLRADAVAAAAESIRAHYRFYAFTKAAVSLDAAFDGPAAGSPTWSKPEGTPSTRPADWAKGTIAAVCSSFIWTAVKRSAGPVRLELEGLAETANPPEPITGAHADDGLYLYSEATRKEAAEVLLAKLKRMVRERALQMAYLKGSNKAFAIEKAAGGVTPESIVARRPPDMNTDGALFAEDVPDDIATQFCNTMAKDRADEEDEELYEEPGIGIAVSPDDIRLRWDAPGPQNPDVQRGLWASEVEAVVVPAGYGITTISVWERSEGMGVVTGRVLVNGRAKAGAIVKVGCREVTTAVGLDGVPGFELVLPAGNLEFTATWTSPANRFLATAEVHGVGPGFSTPRIDLVVAEQESWRRKLRVSGHWSTVERWLINNKERDGAVAREWVLQHPPAHLNPPVEAVNKKLSTFIVLPSIASVRGVIEIDAELLENLDLLVTVKSLFVFDWADYSDRKNEHPAEDWEGGRRGYREIGPNIYEGDLVEEEGQRVSFRLRPGQQQTWQARHDNDWPTTSMNDWHNVDLTFYNEDSPMPVYPKL